MISPGIFFKDFKIKKKSKSLKKRLNFLLKENNSIIQSLRKEYKDNFEKKKYLNLKNYQILELLVWGAHL